MGSRTMRSPGPAMDEGEQGNRGDAPLHAAMSGFLPTLSDKPPPTNAACRAYPLPAPPARWPAMAGLMPSPTR